MGSLPRIGERLDIVEPIALFGTESSACHPHVDGDIDHFDL